MAVHAFASHDASEVGDLVHKFGLAWLGCLGFMAYQPLRVI